MEDIQGLLETKYNETYLYYSEYLGKFNSDALMQRGDIFGFMAILATVREAEATGNGESHFVFCADLYRAIPAILKFPWLNEHFELFKECIVSIHHRMWTSRLLFSVDWEVIQRQILDPTFETERDRRRRDPESFRFIELEDPIVINLKCGTETGA
jgi:hypothetical protein